MDDFNAVVTNSKLPRQLKDYFMTNNRVNDVIEIELIKEIEELYVYYKSLYIFDSIEFSAYVITSLKDCTNSKLPFSHVKKTIDTNLDLKSSHRFSLKNQTVDKVFAEVFNDFCEIVDNFYKNNLNKINLVQTYKNLGKMELINDLVEDKEYQDLISMGKDIMNSYIKCDG